MPNDNALINWGHLVRFASNLKETFNSKFGSSTIVLYKNANLILADLDDAKENTLYQMQIISGFPDNLPTNYPTNGALHRLLTTTVKTSSTAVSKQKSQYIFNNNMQCVWKRSYNETWSDWTVIRLPNFEIFSANLFRNASNTLADLNDANENTLYQMQITSGFPDNLPTNYPTNGALHRLLTTAVETDMSGTITKQKSQYIFNSNMQCVWKRSYSGTWSNWTNIEAPGLEIFSDNLFRNASNTLADVNNAKENTIYQMQITSGMPSHLPSNYPTNGALHRLLTIATKTDMSGTIKNQKTQYIFNSNMQCVWKRSYNDTWGDWTNIELPSTNGIVITCGQGKQYTRLRDAVAKGVELGCKVMVYPGVYDLTEEFEVEIEEGIEEETGTVGITLGNDVHVIFMSGAYVKAIFDDSSRWVYDSFEPFRSNGSFTLENLNIECANTRYCIHDEHNGSGTYIHKYLNCRMKYINEHSDINYVACIGGGLGEHGTIVIDGGYYESHTDYGVSSYGVLGTAENCQQPITFHNGNNVNCDSHITIKNVYLADRGYFRFGNYGPSDIKSMVEVNNCSVGLPILNIYESTDSTHENFNIVAYNNTVRNTKVNFAFSRVIDIIED